MAGRWREMEQEAGSGSSPAQHATTARSIRRHTGLWWLGAHYQQSKHKHKHSMSKSKSSPVAAWKSMQSSQGRRFLSRHFLGLASAHQPAPSCSRHLMHLPGAISIAQFRNLTKVCLDPASSSSWLLQRSILSLFFFQLRRLLAFATTTTSYS